MCSRHINIEHGREGGTIWLNRTTKVGSQNFQSCFSREKSIALVKKAGGYSISLSRCFSVLSIYPRIMFSDPKEDGATLPSLSVNTLRFFLLCDLSGISFLSSYPSIVREVKNFCLWIFYVSVNIRFHWHCVFFMVLFNYNLIIRSPLIFLSYNYLRRY